MVLFPPEVREKKQTKPKKKGTAAQCQILHFTSSFNDNIPDSFTDTVIPSNKTY